MNLFTFLLHLRADVLGLPLAAMETGPSLG